MTLRRWCDSCRMYHGPHCDSFSRRDFDLQPQKEPKMDELRARAEKQVRWHLEGCESALVGRTNPLPYPSNALADEVAVWRHLLALLQREEEVKPDPKTFHPDYPLGEPYDQREDAEPVAYRFTRGGNNWQVCIGDPTGATYPPAENVQPLYTSPRAAEGDESE